jgi:aspartate aminotransferase
MEIAERMKLIAPSMTLAIDSKAKKMKAEGKNVLNFGAGEPDFNPPAAVIDSAAKAVLDGKNNKYTPAAGTMELRQGIGAWLQKEYNVTYAPGEIVVSCGAKHSLYNTFLSLVNPGDEVLVPSPFWVSYPEQIKMAGGIPVFVDCPESEGFKLTSQAILEKITPKTKVLVLNSPSNPTGAVVDRKTLEGIAEVALKHKLWVISDEIYSKLTYGVEHVCFPSLSKEVAAQTILVNGASKTYAMTGWRIGYACGPAFVMKSQGDLQSHSTSNPTAVAQKAFLAALSTPESELEAMRQVYVKRRDMMVDGLNRIPGIHCQKPDGAFYVFPNVKGLWKGDRNTSMKLSDYLLEKALLAITPGIAFGAEGYLRLSYATSDVTIQEGLKRLADAVK